MIKENVKIGGDWKFSANPGYIKEREAIWDSLMERQNKKYTLE